MESSISECPQSVEYAVVPQGGPVSDSDYVPVYQGGTVIFSENNPTIITTYTLE